MRWPRPRGSCLRKSSRMRGDPPTFFALLTLLMAGCAGRTPSLTPALPPAPSSAELLDPERNRRIPVLVYGAEADGARPLALISPGYGIGHGDYRFIADELDRRGFRVAAVQHVLDDDPPVPGGDNLAVRRRPFWAEGVANLRRVAAELRRRGLATEAPMLLIGHSHGGDIAMLHATLHPDEVGSVFSLDNRRMPWPRADRPRLCSARSSDHPADAGVLPTPGEQARFGMIVVPTTVRHDDMWEGADAGGKAAMLGVLRQCLEGAGL